MKDNEVISFGSLKPYGIGPDGAGVEFYQIIIDSDRRGKGYVRQTFEEKIRLALEIAAERELDNFYTSVLKQTTDHYTRINNENETTGYSDIVRIAEEEGLEEDVFKPNPMSELVEDYGFEANDEKCWKTDYSVVLEELMNHID